MVQGRDVGNFVVSSDHHVIPFNEHLGADHLTFEQGGGMGDLVCVRISFPKTLVIVFFP